MKRKATSLIAILLLVSGLAFFLPKNEGTSIRLRFNSSYKGDTISKQKTGLMWGLSFLGAELPKHSFTKSLKPVGGDTYELDITGLGFNNNAVLALKRLIIELKASEEYQKMGGIDLGEFIVFTLGSSWHYYEITGAEKSLSTYRKRYGEVYKTVFPTLRSSVAKHHRLIKMNDATEVKNMSFIAEEGNGDIDKETFVSETYEVFDIMKNGQLRFAVYDKAGNLKDASEKKYGEAGKPIKCLWCHETYIQPLYEKNDSLVDYLSPREFQKIIGAKMNALKTYRENLHSDMDYTQKQDHAFMELLYINYMEPSAFKLANEWGLSEEIINDKIKNNTTHAHGEYPFLNNQFRRGEIKKFSPYTTVNLPDSIWTENGSEPNIFYLKK